MKLKRKEYEIAIIVFLLTFLLSFYFFGGFSKLQRLKEASKVEKANAEYLAIKEVKEKEEAEKRKKEEEEKRKRAEERLAKIPETPPVFEFNQIDEFTIKESDLLPDGYDYSVTWSYDTRKQEKSLFGDKLWGEMSDDEKAVYIMLKDEIFEALKNGVKKLNGELLKQEEGAEEDLNDITDEDLYAWEDKTDNPDWQVAFMTKNDFAESEKPYFSLSLSHKEKQRLAEQKQEEVGVKEVAKELAKVKKASLPPNFYFPEGVKVDEVDVTEEVSEKNANLKIEYAKKWKFMLNGYQELWEEMSKKEQDEFNKFRAEFFKTMDLNIKEIKGELTIKEDNDEETLSQGRRDAYFEEYLTDAPSVLKWSVVIYSAEKIASGKPALYGEVYHLELKKEEKEVEVNALDKAFSVGGDKEGESAKGEGGRADVNNEEPISSTISISSEERLGNKEEVESNAEQQGEGKGPGEGEELKSRNVVITPDEEGKEEQFEQEGSESRGVLLTPDEEASELNTGAEWIEYKVLSGDTWSRISAIYGKSIAELKEKNNDTDLYVGHTILVPNIVNEF